MEGMRLGANSWEDEAKILESVVCAGNGWEQGRDKRMGKRDLSKLPSPNVRAGVGSSQSLVIKIKQDQRGRRRVRKG